MYSKACKVHFWQEEELLQILCISSYRWIIVEQPWLRIWTGIVGKHMVHKTLSVLQHTYGYFFLF